MKILIYFMIPLIAFAQNTNAILQELINFKSTTTYLDLSYNPFKKVVKNSFEEANYTLAKKESPSGVKAILNHKAFIDDSWYSVGDILGGFRIEKITNDMVYLKKGNEIKNLKFLESKKYLSVKEK